MGILTHPTERTQGTLRSGAGALGECSWEEGACQVLSSGIASINSEDNRVP